MTANPQGPVRVVPLEPTEEMLIAGHAKHDDFYGIRAPYPRTRAVYAAMLAAAPSPAAPEGVEALWMMHVVGPDDIYPAPDYETARAWSDYVNNTLAARLEGVLCKAVPTIWTGTPEAHAEALPEAIKGWTVPLADGGR